MCVCVVCTSECFECTCAETHASMYLFMYVSTSVCAFV